MRGGKKGLEVYIDLYEGIINCSKNWYKLIMFFILFKYKYSSLLSFKVPGDQHETSSQNHRVLMSTTDNNSS